MFIRMLRGVVARGRCRTPVTPADDLILAAIGATGAKRGYRRRLWPSSVLDVLVVGAGPAGVAAGIEARRLGLDVARRRQGPLPPRQDLRRRPHHRCAAPARRRSASTSAPCRRAVGGHRDRAGRRPTGREVEVPLPPDGAYAGVVPARRARRRAGRARAARAGVDVREGVAVTGVARATTTAVDVDARRRHRRRAPASWSPPTATTRPSAACSARRRRRRSARWHAFRQYFTGVDDRRLWVLFEEDLLPGLRVGVPASATVAPTSASACCATDDAPSGKALAAQWREPGRPPERPPRARTRTPSPRARVRGVADPRRVRPRPPHATARAVRRRRRRRRRPDDRRRHRAGARDGMLAAARDRAAPATHDAVAARYRADVDRALGADLRLRRAAPARAARPARRARRDRAPPRSPRGPAATSPAGCSRTTPAPCCSRPRRWHRGMLPTPTGTDGLLPTLVAMAVTDHWLTAPHWSTDIPLDTPHPRVDALAEHGYVVLRDLDHADPRVRVPRPRVHGLEERRRHQLRARRHRRRRARLPRLLEAGRRASRQGRALHVERRAVPDASSPRSSRSAPTSGGCA